MFAKSWWMWQIIWLYQIPNRYVCHRQLLQHHALLLHHATLIWLHLQLVIPCSTTFIKSLAMRWWMWQIIWLYQIPNRYHSQERVVRLQNCKLRVPNKFWENNAQSCNMWCSGKWLKKMILFPWMTFTRAQQERVQLGFLCIPSWALHSSQTSQNIGVMDFSIFSVHLPLGR